MHIISLAGDNFKRLRAVRIHAEGVKLMEVAGQNAQGKTSVLDLIWAVLGGKKASPEKPIRDGALRAEGTIDLGVIKVTRRWTTNENSSIVVESGDGVPMRSPQEVLNKLVGLLTFDPLAFARNVSEQAPTLRAIAGLDFAQLDAKHQEAYDKRTVLNREIKQLDAQLTGTPVVAAPDQETSIADLVAKMNAANQEKNANDKKRAGLADLKNRRIAAQKGIDDLRERLAHLEEQQRQLTEHIEGAEFDVVGLKDPNVAEISAQMQNLEASNVKVRQKLARRDLEARAREKVDAVRGLEKTIDDVKEQKRAQLAAAKFPIDGLSVDGDIVTFNEQPFSQASQAEQIRVSLAIGAALNPKLRVLLVREGSLLDKNALAEVERWAAANDIQVWMERVGDQLATATGVIIEDGEIKA